MARTLQKDDQNEEYVDDDLRGHESPEDRPVLLSGSQQAVDQNNESDSPHDATAYSKSLP